MKQNKQIDVQRGLALSGAFNFLVCCSRSCLLPFFTLYLRQLGLTPAMTGVVMGTRRLVALVWSPVSGLLSKHYDRRRAVVVGSLMCSAAVALVLLFIPPADVNAQTCNVSSEVSGGATQRPLTSLKPRPKPTSAPGATSNAKTLDKDGKSAPDVTSKPAETHPANATNSLSAAPARNKRSKVKPEGEQEVEGSHAEFLGSLKAMDPQHQLFFLILIAVSLWEFVSAPLEWTADDGLYEYLDFADASDRYGGSSTGAWSLLGAACGVGGAGLLVSQLPCLIGGQTTRSAVHFYSYAAVAALALPLAAYLPLHLNRKRDRANGLLKAAQLVRASPRALLCAVTALLVGVATSAVDDFLLWQMQDRGGGELHMGLSLAVALLSQAAFPLLLATRVSRLLGPGRVLAVAAACVALQCFYYSFLWAPWAVLPAQMLSCFGSGALWWAVQVQCEDVATPGAERSVRRVYGALSLHVGGAVGSFAGGFVVQRFGLPWLFRGAGLCVMAWCLCLPLLQCRAPRQRRINYSRLLAADASEASESESEQERDWLDKAMEDDRSNNNYGRRTNR